MKRIYYFAAMAALLASCSSDQLPEERAAVQQNVEPGAVLFDVYAQRSITRAGTPGSFTTDGLKTGVFAGDGFGVFGFYTNSSTYDQQAIPNFFYNQQVKWDGGGYFKYEPVKYWPNEYGTTAQSEDADKVTFFAYAPYIDVVPATGKPTQEGATPEQTAELQKWGINSLTRNNATGDPMVKYIASFDQDKSVDLCWGVCDDPNWRIIQTGGMQGDLQEGLPWLNVQRPAEATELGAAGQKLKFTFKHATAQLKVNIDAFVDGLDNDNSIASGTKVYVRSITFEGLATKGTLNLNNTEAGANKAYWLDFNGTNDLTTGESVTIYDGRKDGKEGTPSGVATNEKALGLNPDLIQADIWANSAAGVTKDLKNLFRKYNETTKEYEAANLPIYVIPTGDPVKVTITYDIETADENLATYVSDVQQHGSSVENVITKEIDFGGTTILENGKSYVINLHLGMNSVKFDAAVKPWDDSVEADVHLPYNAPVASAVATGAGTPITVDLPAAGGNGLLKVSGLAKDETVVVSTDATGGITFTTGYPETTPNAGSAVGANGIVESKYSIDPNTKISDVSGTLTVGDGTRSVVLTINQKAHALDLAAPTINNEGKVITLTSGASGMINTDWTGMAATITISKKDKDGNVTSFVGATDAAVAGSKFKVESTGTSATLTFADADEVKAGDVLTITVDPNAANKAAAETVTLKIGGIAFIPNAYSIEYGTVGFKPEPIAYGLTVTGYSDAASSQTSTATITSATDPTIVTAGVNSSTPTEISMTAGYTAVEGYAYTTNSVKSKYNLTVTKAIGTLSYSLDDKSNQTTAVDDVVIANIKKATQTNSHGDPLNETVTYAITSVDGVAGAGKFKLDGDALKVATELDAGTTYVIQIEATVADDDNKVNFTNNSQTATFTVKTVAP